MSISKTITTAAVMTGLAAMNIASFGSTAQAYDGRGDGRSGWRGHAPAYRHAGPPARHYSRGDHDDRGRGRDKALSRGLAIGLGAVIIGGILAAEANRRNHADYD